MHQNVDIDQAATQLSSLLEKVEQGEMVTITRAGQPIADLVPHSPRRITFGTLAGHVSYDEATAFGPDDDIVEMFEGPK